MSNATKENLHLIYYDLVGVDMFISSLWTFMNKVQIV